MTQTKLSPATKRFDFIREVTSPLEQRARAILIARKVGQEIPDLTVDELRAIAIDMRAKGEKLGRTDRWLNAIAFADIEIEIAKKAGTLDESTARWAVTQGSVFMAHAAE